MSGDRPACRRQAMNLLARREHARLELARKLDERGYESGLVAAVLDELENDGLLAEDRFVESFVRSRISRGQGPVRIRLELNQRGIDNPDPAIASVPEDWSALARAVRTRRFGEAPPGSLAERARQTRFLQYRGFTAEQIRDALESADD